MATIYIVTHWWDGDAVLGTPVASFLDTISKTDTDRAALYALEQANNYCLEYVRGLAPIGETIEDRSTDELAHWEWDGGHKLGSAFVTRLKVQE